VSQNYLIISISFYLFIAILSAKMSRVNKALKDYEPIFTTSKAASKNAEKVVKNVSKVIL